MADEDRGATAGMDMMSIDEMEEISREPETPETPKEEESKGPSITEVMEQVNKLQNALKVSEEARMQAQQMATQQGQQQEEEAPLTDDELAQLMQTDSIAAVRYMQDRALKEAEKHLERRLAGLSIGSVVAGKTAAAARYPTEFQLFEKEIEAAINQLGPQQREALADPKNWDQLIGYIRGQPGNFERYLQHHTQQTPEAARQNAEVNSGFAATTRRVQPVTQNSAGLDDIQLKIAEELGITPEDYKKWMRS